MRRGILNANFPQSSLANEVRNDGEGVAAKLHFRSPALPTRQRRIIILIPRALASPKFQNLIDSDSFNVNESGRLIVAGILFDLKNSCKLPFCEEIASSIDHRKLDHRHPLGLIFLLRGVASFFVQTSVPRSRACLRTGRGNKNVYALQTSLSNTWPLSSETNDSP